MDKTVGHGAGPREYFLAEYVDANPDSPTFGQKVLGEVTPEGETPDGSRMSRWARVRADTLEEAKSSYLAERFEPVVAADTQQLPAATPPAHRRAAPASSAVRRAALPSCRGS